MSKEKISKAAIKRARHDYYSYEEYLEIALRGQGGAHTKSDEQRSSRRESEAKWAGTPNWEKCCQLVERGWKEGREMVGKILKDIHTVEADVYKPGVVWDVEGDTVDVGRYVSGEPESMMRWEPELTQKRIARILFPISVSAGVSPELMQWRGATMLALIDRLEASGVRCHVDICYGVKEQSPEVPAWFMIANVKSADEILHLDRMAFHLAHPSSFRRVMFSLAENGPDGMVKGHGTYRGGFYGIPLQNVQPYFEGQNAYDLVMGGVYLSTVDEAIKEIEKMFDIICPDTVERVMREEGGQEIISGGGPDYEIVD